MERLFVLLNSWDILFTLLSNSFDPRVMLSRRILGTTAFRERLPPGFSSELPLLLFASFFLVSQKQKQITNSVENWINKYFFRWTREKKRQGRRKHKTVKKYCQDEHHSSFAQYFPFSYFYFFLGRKQTCFLN